MKWIEVITARLAAPLNTALIDALRASVKCTPDDSLRRVEFFRNFAMNNELAIHLTHESKYAALSASAHEQRLTECLREMGLVHQAIWVPCSENK